MVYQLLGYSELEGDEGKVKVILNLESWLVLNASVISDDTFGTGEDAARADGRVCRIFHCAPPHEA